MIRKTIAALLAAALALTACALAEAYDGVTVAASTVPVACEASGALEELNVQPGQRVEAGDLLGRVRASKVFAAQDGSVAIIDAEAGDSVDGAVLEIMPKRRYTIYCTSEDAYEDPETMQIHSGEQVYIKCKVNGTHRGVGIVTGVTGNEYQVETIGGTFYVGEAVYLYRDADFSSEQRVGVGTLIETPTEVYEASGTIEAMHVYEGQSVERGQLLYSVVDGRSAEIAAPTSGIVAAVAAEAGETVSDGQVVFEIVEPDAIVIEISVDEARAGRLSPGDACIWQTADSDETHPGSVLAVIGDGANGVYRVQIASPDLPARLGSRVEVRLD